MSKQLFLLGVEILTHASGQCWAFEARCAHRARLLRRRLGSRLKGGHPAHDALELGVLFGRDRTVLLLAKQILRLLEHRARLSLAQGKRGFDSSQLCRTPWRHRTLRHLLTQLGRPGLLSRQVGISHRQLAPQPNHLVMLFGCDRVLRELLLQPCQTVPQRIRLLRERSRLLCKLAHQLLLLRSRIEEWPLQAQLLELSEFLGELSLEHRAPRSSTVFVLFELQLALELDQAILGPRELIRRRHAGELSGFEAECLLDDRGLGSCAEADARE